MGGYECTDEVDLANSRNSNRSRATEYYEDFDTDL